MRFHNSHRPAAECRGAAIILACVFLFGLLAGAFLCRDAWNQLPVEISALACGSTLFGLLTVLLGRLLIPVLRRRRAGQPILEIGPSWHLSKAGTPTLGGLAFMGGICGALLLCGIYLGVTGRSAWLPVPVLVFSYAVLCGGIGFLDDYRKLSKRENKGLSPWEKYLLQ